MLGDAGVSPRCPGAMGMGFRGRSCSPDGFAVKELSVRGNHSSAFPCIPLPPHRVVFGGQDGPAPPAPGKPRLKRSSTPSSGVKQAKRRIFQAGRFVDVPGTPAPFCMLPPSSSNRKSTKPAQKHLLALEDCSTRHWDQPGAGCSEPEDLSEDDSKAGKGPILSHGQHKFTPGTSPKIQ